MNLGRKGTVRYIAICLAKTKALISFPATAKLICVFVFAYTELRFSHHAAQMVTCDVLITLLSSQMKIKMKIKGIISLVVSIAENQIPTLV